MEASCSVVMNSNPVTYETSVPRAEIVRTMKDEGIRHIPLLGQDGRVVDLMTLSEIMGAYRQDSPVVIMAGGQGKRLGELTHNCPKPMLDVGGRPILETIIQNFIDQGFFRFFISVNYLSAQIKFLYHKFPHYLSCSIFFSKILDFLLGEV